MVDFKASSKKVAPSRLAYAWYAERAYNEWYWKRAAALFSSYAGNWNEGFDDQGDNGNLWSSSANPGNADNALNANFNATDVNPGDNNNRDNGIGVRWLLCNITQV